MFITFLSFNDQEDMAFKLLQPKLSREKLMDYRRQWTCDKESSRKIRFQTESRLAGNAVGGKFHTNTVRILPGTPKSMEEYRSRLVERYGIFALAALRFHIGMEQLSIQEFRDRIQDIGVVIKPYELSQVTILFFSFIIYLLIINSTISYLYFLLDNCLYYTFINSRIL